jgi:hypothetical protein
MHEKSRTSAKKVLFGRMPNALEGMPASTTI